MTPNLYVHFPFCRRKCSYCALHSRVGVSEVRRRCYVEALARAVSGLPRDEGCLTTIYFGGGSPALCDLTPIFEALEPLRDERLTEFTVELHPLDVSPELLRRLKSGGVNRISMGVQSLDDAVLTDMGRGYDVALAERAFACIREWFDNAGIDLIVGYPGEGDDVAEQLERLRGWGLRHCSVYSLIYEDKSILSHRMKRESLPGDEETLDRLKVVARMLAGFGLDRYEISNYAAEGFECRHNLAVWRGEDYLGLGEGAFGRVGLRRTQNSFGGLVVPGLRAAVEETVSAEDDEKERRLFRLRTREGLDASGRPKWRPVLDKFVDEGLLTKEGRTYRLTDRGTEVCDSILAEII